MRRDCITMVVLVRFRVTHSSEVEVLRKGTFHAYFISIKVSQVGSLMPHLKLWMDFNLVIVITVGRAVANL